MTKKLIVFCDGTWNRADQKTRDGKPCPTNVLRLFEATLQDDAKDKAQVALYIPGVGTRWDEKLLGGTFGYGISANVRDAYSFIVSNYEKGDEIFLFGFSRGAFTARSIAGMINRCGVLRRDRLHLVSEAYDHYRDTSGKWSRDSDLSKTFRAANTHGDETIAFIGVWDTVGALGAPYGALMAKLTNLLFHTQFHDVQLSSIVMSAYHAVAIDERRWPFRPTLWELKQEHRDRCAAAAAKGEPPPYEQKWFPGVHSNVGGGYVTTGLADCALEWMIGKSAQHGMKADTAKIGTPPFQPDLREALHDSQTLLYRLTTFAFVYLPKLWLKRQTPQDAPLLDRVQWNGDYVRLIDGHDELSPCALEKLAQDASYRPPNVEMA
jgi:uncharacterized protein (DUF2235 family)